jgi:predicted NBD/HSP70 family sugar kinase
MLIDGAALTRLSLLKAIRKNGPVSRVELAEMLGLSKGTVSEITAELIQSGFVSEEGNTSAERGRPRVLLRIQAGNFAVVGANLDPFGFIELCIVDLAGGLISKQSSPLPQLGSIECLMSWIGDVVDCFIDDTPIERARVASVSVAHPGHVESSTGLLHWFPSLPGHEIPFAQVVSQRIGIPVIIENDVDCLARAEHWFGDSTTADFAIVYQGLSVGLAQYSDGLPRTGSSGVNSEFGHVKTDYSEDARSCFCGGRGCVTSYSSYRGLFISNASGEADLDHRIEEVIEQAPAIIEAARSGDPAKIKACATAGHHLGLAIANFINTVDPRQILVRTSDPNMPDLIRPSFEAAIRQHTLEPLLRRTAIEIGSAQPDWRWKGTAALALEQAYLGTAVRQARRTSRNAASAARPSR